MLSRTLEVSGHTHRPTSKAAVSSISSIVALRFETHLPSKIDLYGTHIP